MMKFLIKQKFFSLNQYGFIPGRNTSEAIQAHIHEVVDNLENKEKVIGFYLDISKAFDTVNHEILLNKLYKAGFRGNIHDWLTSYLTERNQRVKYRAVQSTNLPVITGVPQGGNPRSGPFLDICEQLTSAPIAGPSVLFCR